MLMIWNYAKFDLPLICWRELFLRIISLKDTFTFMHVSARKFKSIKPRLSLKSK